MYPLQFNRLRRVPVSPVVWSLGFTSLLTDLSTEMVTSALPAYLVLHLHISPFTFGIIDGIQNGLAAALLGIGAALFVDRTYRHKQVAIAGYGISAVSKLLLFILTGAWGWILIVVGLDRVGKGIRAPPRDALISLNTPSSDLANAFAVHRALDAGGALLGPIVAFALLWYLPGGFSVVWFASLLAAILGIGVLWSFVPEQAPVAPRSVAAREQGWMTPLRSARFAGLAACGLVLSLLTVSDAFIYLLLQQRSSTPVSLFPLFYVVTACAYMLWVVPLGRIADRFGRARIFLIGYAVLAVVYLLLIHVDRFTLFSQLGCLALLGLYYASTEGTLMAMASAGVPAEVRTTNIAIVAAAVGLGKVISSVMFGWLWFAYGAGTAVSVFAIALAGGGGAAAFWFATRARRSASYA